MLDINELGKRSVTENNENGIRISLLFGAMLL